MRWPRPLPSLLALAEAVDDDEIGAGCDRTGDAFARVLQPADVEVGSPLHRDRNPAPAGASRRCGPAPPTGWSRALPRPAPCRPHERPRAFRSAAKLAQDRIGVLMLVIDQGREIALGIEHGAPPPAHDPKVCSGFPKRLCAKQQGAGMRREPRSPSFIIRPSGGPLMICSWVNSARPSSANSVPMPDCLAPPNGMCGAMSRCLLIQTVPASIRWRPRGRA